MELLGKLKALFNNVFTLKNLSCMSLHAISVLIRCKNEALKKLHLKSTIKCFKKANICKWPEITYSFLPHRLLCWNKWSNQTVYSVVIFSHRYLERDCINFKTFVFLAVYWSSWTSSYNTHIKSIKKKLNGASTIINNVFKSIIVVK